MERNETGEKKIEDQNRLCHLAHARLYVTQQARAHMQLRMPKNGLIESGNSPDS